MAISGLGQNTHAYQTYFVQQGRASTSAGNGQAPAATQTQPASGGSGASQGLIDQIDQILEKGLQAWAEEKRLEELKAEIRDEVMGELGITTEDLGKMEEEMRKRVEQRIEDMVRERLEAALQQGGEQQRTDAKPSVNIVV